MLKAILFFSGSGVLGFMDRWDSYRGRCYNHGVLFAYRPDLNSIVGLFYCTAGAYVVLLNNKSPWSCYCQSFMQQS